MHIRNTRVFLLLFFCYPFFATMDQCKKAALPDISLQKKNAQPLSPPTKTVEHKADDSPSAKMMPIVEKKISRIITVKNTITPEMTKYRFWGSYYTPTKFYLSVNNNPVQSNESCKCTITENNVVAVTYHYEFKNGMVTGSKCIEFELPTDASNIDITFSWDDRYRLKGNVGRAINAKNGTMKSTRKFL